MVAGQALVCVVQVRSLAVRSGYDRNQYHITERGSRMAEDFRDMTDDELVESAHWFRLAWVTAQQELPAMLAEHDTVRGRIRLLLGKEG